LSFHGIHEHTLDAKNRLTVPSKQRAGLADGVTVAKGFEPCLQVWAADAYAEVARQSLAGLPPLSRQARDLKRHLFGNTTATELDSAGRIMLPPGFLEHASIRRSVMLVGTGECLELWDPETWKTYDAGLVATAAEHIEHVGHPA
jgi:MraZ protein